jgi:hypothetical protein
MHITFLAPIAVEGADVAIPFEGSLNTATMEIRITKALTEGPRNGTNPVEIAAASADTYGATFLVTLPPYAHLAPASQVILDLMEAHYFGR